jgi:voltage-gated potassium channel
MYHAVKGKVHSLLHPEYGDTKLDKAINAFIIILIVLNVIAVILETVPSIHDPHQRFFKMFDLVSVIIFSIEYVFRVWSSNHEAKYKHSFHGRLRYMLTPGALIDLLAILPYYLHVIVGFDLRMLRMLRLFRFLRLFRLTAYMKSAKIVRNVFVSKASDLKLSLLLILFLIIISASLVYFAEHLAQPAVFSSIPKTFWWAVVTVTTVGYGDMVPITVAGKILTAIIALAGIALFALPAGIITAGFLEETRKVKHSKAHFCPHCGEPLDHPEQHD